MEDLKLIYTKTPTTRRLTHVLEDMTVEREEEKAKLLMTRKLDDLDDVRAACRRSDKGCEAR